MRPGTITEFVSSSENNIDKDKMMDVICQAGLEDKINSLTRGIDSKLMKGVFDDSIGLSGGEVKKIALVVHCIKMRRLSYWTKLQ